MQYFGQADWAPDEDASGATVSILGRQWTGLTSSDTVVDGTWGLYTAHLTFDGDGDVVGLDAEPTFAVFLGTKVPGSGLPQPDVASYSWAPDMTRLVADSWNTGQIRVVDAASGDVVPLGAGEDPDWSPDGSKIAYRRLIDGKKPGDALQTVRPDGSGVSTVLFLKRFVSSVTSQYLDFPKWSPDGAYLAYQHTLEDNGSSWTRYIYRIAADGTGNTNLTPEVTTGSGGASFGLSLRDWR
jgi:Tol biopolymer transport system component